ncbi:MAG: hypothetical protein J5590_01565, partial [Clostridia bacterium]|nr:hypothetical protein [Clostridia bacterium]
GDYIAVKKIALGKVNAPTDKQLLSADVADGVMDGLIDNGDYIAVKRVALRKDADFEINSKN